ncbi:MAG: transketolase [Deltaproteobacteria bacterium]|nr:transketolase [Deltaproteobacteria bacterium]
METHHIAASTVRALAMDMVTTANSGHPGMPLGAADFATVLWTKLLKHDPTAPQWPDRDRFVLSAGHGSALLYALLHLSGYDLPMEELRRFRQWGSRTPGHPEYGHTVGVETTTGPLGQGFANAVGMALAERWLSERFGTELVDHRTYVVVGDGCLMEGVSSEAGSIAGHLGLGKLIALYDDNHITIDGATEVAFTEDVLARFEAFGWQVLATNGHDEELIEAAIEQAIADTTRPSLIAMRTTIGKGSDLEHSPKCHGSPFSPDAVKVIKSRMGMLPDATFTATAEAYAAFRGEEGPQAHAAWQARLDAHPRKEEFLALLAGDQLAEGVSWPEFAAGSQIATRKSSEAALKAIVRAHPEVLGGSADLAGSNGTALGVPFLSADGFDGARMIPFGVREHGMGAVANGMILHGGVRPFVATFMVFHDYMRPAVRMAALMGLGVVYVYTHDSFLLGEDGPTHQPVETLLAMRSIPGLRVIRPAEATETVEAWRQALARRDGPTALVLSRQNLPTLEDGALAASLSRGGYVVDEGTDVVLIATGSEVSLARSARALLAERGLSARVVSMPCRELFAEQDASYRAQVLPAGVPRVSVEAGLTLGWERWIGQDGLAIGVDHFGASAPDAVLAEHFGFTPEAVAARVATHLGR